jgi:hypothetical protein
MSRTSSNRRAAVVGTIILRELSQIDFVQTFQLVRMRPFLTPGDAGSTAFVKKEPQHGG